MTQKPTYVSPSSMKVLGFSSEERMQQHLSEMMTPETYARVTELLARDPARDNWPKNSLNRSEPDLIDATLCHYV